MAEKNSRETGGLMLVSPERVFYAGLLGRPRQRTSGGYNVYVALQGLLHFVIGDQRFSAQMAFVPPYTTHSVVSDHPSIISIVIEPETVDPSDVTNWVASLSQPALVARIRAAYDELCVTPCGELSTEAFDTLFLGRLLMPCRLDPRIARSIALLNDISGTVTTAEDCARAAGLSQSRFLHLFKDETAISFRAMRAWKRARHLLHFANRDINLAHLAQDIGYPDSTHFSHSIRRFYGLKPRAILMGSRDLAIVSSGRVAELHGRF